VPWSRNLFFFETEDDDSEGFYNYVAKAQDPGYVLFIATAVFCLATVISLPCMVILGDRYERHRVRKQIDEEMLAAEEEADAKEGMVTIPLSGVREEDIEMADLSRCPSNALNGKQRGSARKKKVKSEVGSAMTNRTNTSSFIHGRGGKNMHAVGIKGNFTKVMDKMVILPYPDDDNKSVFSYTYPTSNVGSALTSNVGSTTASNVTSTHIFDARNGKRRKGHSKQNAYGRARRLQKQVQIEEEEFPYERTPRRSRGPSRAQWSDTRSEAGVQGALATGARFEDDVQSHAARSEMGMSVQKRHVVRTPLSKMLRRGGRSGSPDRSVVSKAMDDRSVLSKMVDDISPNDAADANDPGQMKPYEDEEELQICCGKNALWRPAVIARAFDKLIEIAEPDNETKRILKLTVPFTLGEIMEATFEVIGMGLIGHFIGTDALAAYTVVEMLVGTTGEFIDGIIDAQTTVATHAIGVGNNYLAGQYTQQAAIFYSIAMIPCTLTWWFCTYPAMIWLGFDHSIAMIAKEYARVAMLCDLLEGLADVYHGILEITDHEVFSTVLDIIEGLVELMIFGAILMFHELKLIDLVWIQIGLDAAFFLFTIVLSYKKGWMRPFWAGMFKNFSLKNTRAVKNLLGTAVPLSLGNLLSYAEWEILTLFASHMGPAEVTTWSIMGTVWETFEASTEGIGDGGEIRVAYHLGKGNPTMARVSAYKSLLIGTIFGFFITAIFFIMGDDMPTWLTVDPTLQNMVGDLIPLVGLGNITMTFGMVCWALIGAQGRYRLATMIQFVCSWGITMPLAAAFTYLLNYDLKGITSAVVIGYAIAGTAMSYVILRSDWERLSRIVIELNKITGEVESSDSESDDDSSSSSSSSSDSSDSDDSSDDSSDESTLDTRSRRSKGSSRPGKGNRRKR